MSASALACFERAIAACRAARVHLAEAARAIAGARR